MKIAIWFSLVVAVLPTLVMAQQQKKKNEDAFVREKPTVGDRLPDLVVYDVNGNEVKTSALRGHYTVLTFGCLT